MRIGIIGIGASLPSHVMTNKDMEKLVDTSDEWILTRTGIKTRRIVDPGIGASELGAHAAHQALKDAGLLPEQIDLIIVATITPDMQFPSTSCIIQKKIGAHHAACFDISAACAGYLYAISVAQSLLMMKTYRNALVIGAETLSTITDWTDRSTCVLFGDGAGAVVLAPVQTGGILTTYLGADGRESEILKVPAGGSLLPTSEKTVEERLHYIKMQGSEVFKHAVRFMSHAVTKVMHDAHVTVDDIVCFIPHQANIRIIEAMRERLHIPVEKMFVNVDKYGNMSSASSAVALYEVATQKPLKKGDKIVQVAFGAGITWGATIIEWSR